MCAELRPTLQAGAACWESWGYRLDWGVQSSLAPLTPGDLFRACKVPAVRSALSSRKPVPAGAP